MRVLELYSGIGGMHCALEQSDIPYDVIAAIDINTTANNIYRHNFPTVNLMEFGIEALTVQQLDKMKIDMILMSPPCQPFTRVGKRQDSDDIRTKSFFHLLSLLPRLKHCPSYILVENVKGFEESNTRDKLVETLKICNFCYQECMLTPLQFGVPNSRLRYYLIAKRQPKKFQFPISDQILSEIPNCGKKFLSYLNQKNKSHETDTNSKPFSCESDSCSKVTNQSMFSNSPDCIPDQNNQLQDNLSADRKTGQNSSEINERRTLLETNVKCWSKTDVCQFCGIDCLQKYSHNMRQLADEDHGDFPNCVRLSQFLEDQPESYFDQYKLSEKELKRFIVMDIVYPCLQKTTCFTKRYGHFMEGAGSIVQMGTDVKVVQDARDFKDQAVELKNRHEWGPKEFSLLKKLELRYFTPREIANLLCFPWSYSFPVDASKIQLYRCLGNSLNVHVVSVLIRLLLLGDDEQNESKE